MQLVRPFTKEDYSFIKKKKKKKKKNEEEEEEKGKRKEKTKTKTNTKKNTKKYKKRKLLRSIDTKKHWFQFWIWRKEVSRKKVESDTFLIATRLSERDIISIKSRHEDILDLNYKQGSANI